MPTTLPRHSHDKNEVAFEDQGNLNLTTKKEAMMLLLVVAASSTEPAQRWDHSARPGNASVGEALATLPRHFHERESQ